MRTKKILYLLLLSIICYFLNFNYSFAAINLDVIPIKEEITVDPGITVTKTAKVRNRSNKTVHLTTGKSDFISNGVNGVPKLVRYSELVHPDQQLSKWISVSVQEFDLAPLETKEIDYYISLPPTATPGGHYGAVCFKNSASESSSQSGTTVPINADYCILLLVNIKGEINSEIEVIEDELNIRSSDGGGWANANKDDCPYGDLSRSYYDDICIDTPEDIIEEITGKKEIQEEKKDNNKEEKESDDTEKDFNITFEIPIENIGNTHIKPEGKIILIDEDGKELKDVGKKIITDENGTIIGEEIVDYIPVNDRGGNILPYTDRIFSPEWKGFPYKTYDNEGNQIIKYWKPGEYYTKKNVTDRGFLMFRERVCERNTTKTIQAIYDISYKDENEDLVEFNTAKEFDIYYKEEYIGTNWYVVIFLGFIVFLIILCWIIAIIRQKRCPKCRKRVKKSMKICPYCGEKLKKRKYNKKKK